MIRWVIAQTIGHRDYPDQEEPIPYRVYYAGGGSDLFKIMHAKADMDWIYEGPAPKFLKHVSMAAQFHRFSMAQEVAFCLSIEEPYLLGRLFVVRLVLPSLKERALHGR